jgi:hypothetical protein
LIGLRLLLRGIGRLRLVLRVRKRLRQKSHKGGEE